MATSTRIHYHLVFATKNRERALSADKREKLFRYTCNILKNKDCHRYRIGGVENYVHILTSVHPTITLADLVNEFKITSSWIKNENIFPGSTHWQDGYGAFTLSHSDKDAVIGYIKDQEEHHKEVSFKDEFRKFLVLS
jgi:putative transposase